MHSTFGRWSALLIAALAGVALSGCGGDDNNNDNSGPPPTAPKVQILSSQPQMVSGTTALIDAELDVGATFSVTLNGADVSGAFKIDPAHPTHALAVVNGVAPGSNNLVVSQKGLSASLALTGYSIAGPIISGP